MVLNNNYHAVHHDLPHLPWFALRDVYRSYRSHYIDANGGFVVHGYSEWLKHYAFAAVAHPAGSRNGVHSATSRVAMRTDKIPSPH